MGQIDFPDRHCVNAAEGWLELGNIFEARTELGKIAAPRGEHPDVLEIEWKICAREKRWDAALLVAQAVIKADPARCSGWLDQSYSLHEMNRTLEAWSHLLPAARKFPQVWTIPYNLACYACRLGNLELARQWLDKAIAILGKEEIKNLALADADLQPMREQLAKL